MNSSTHADQALAAIGAALPAPSGSAVRLGVEFGVRVVFWIALLVLGVFVIWPTASVLRYPGLSDYLDVLTRPRMLTAARNSLFITVGSTAAATFVGFVFAFVSTRSDIPGRKFFRAIGMLPLFAPPFVVAFAYICESASHRAPIVSLFSGTYRADRRWDPSLIHRYFNSAHAVRFPRRGANELRLVPDMKTRSTKSMS